MERFPNNVQTIINDYSYRTKCPICYDMDFKQNMTTTNCLHWFHYVCILNYIKYIIKNTQRFARCPHCRVIIQFIYKRNGIFFVNDLY